MSIYDQLLEFFEPADALLWLSLPHRLLGGRRPEDLIEQGDSSPVQGLIDQLRDGVVV